VIPLQQYLMITKKLYQKTTTNNKIYLNKIKHNFIFLCHEKNSTLYIWLLQSMKDQNLYGSVGCKKKMDIYYFNEYVRTYLVIAPNRNLKINFYHFISILYIGRIRFLHPSIEIFFLNFSIIKNDF